MSLSRLITSSHLLNYNKIIATPIISCYYSTVHDAADQVTWLKKWGRRDMNRRKMVAKHSDERLRLKMLKKTTMLPSLVKLQAKDDLKKLSRDTCVCRVRNRCVLTDRERGTVTQFKLSRHKFQEYARQGVISGLTKSSW